MVAITLGAVLLTSMAGLPTASILEQSHLIQSVRQFRPLRPGGAPSAGVLPTSDAQAQRWALTGRVVDAADGAIAGAAVRISRNGAALDALTDSTGRFRIDGVVAGSYLLTVRLAGFRTYASAVRIDSSPPPVLLIRMTPKVLSEVLWAVPEPAEAYRRAAAIAHLRVTGTRRDGPCGDAQVVSARHDASVLRTFKGQLPETIQLHQEGAGRCSDFGEWHTGFEQTYRAGEEYVIFLTARRDGFGRLGGPSLAFRVRDSVLGLDGFAGASGTVTLDGFRELLNRIGRR